MMVQVDEGITIYQVGNSPSYVPTSLQNPVTLWLSETMMTQLKVL